MRARKFTLPIVVALILTGCGPSHSSSVSAPERPPVAASPSKASTQEASRGDQWKDMTCRHVDPTTKPDGTAPINPRLDGFYQGHESDGSVVAVRFIPDNKVYFVVGNKNFSLESVKSALTASSARNESTIGPWEHDETGAFVNEAKNHYTVLHFKEQHFGLHAYSPYRCPTGTYHQSSYSMTFQKATFTED